MAVNVDDREDRRPVAGRRQQNAGALLLEDVAEAAWVIDVSRGVILEATPAGATRWGTASLRNLAVDRAMPALGRLADLARRLEPGSEARTPLVLWTARGSERIMAHVRRLADAEGSVRFVIAESRTAIDALRERTPVTDAPDAIAVLDGDRIDAEVEIRSGGEAVDVPRTTATAPPSQAAPAAAGGEADRTRSLLERAAVAIARGPVALTRRILPTEMARTDAAEPERSTSRGDVGRSGAIGETQPLAASVTIAPAAGDDGDTLREIARRIRAGLNGTGEPDFPAAAPHVVPAASAGAVTAPTQARSDEANEISAERRAPPQTKPATDAASAVIEATTAATGAVPGTMAPGTTAPATTPIAATATAAADAPAPPLAAAQATKAPANLQRLAHELRTPLSVIASMAEIMRDERLGAMGSERYRAYAGDIFDSAQHGLAVLDAILERDIEGTPVERLELTLIDLNALAERCASGMRPLIERAGLDLQQRFAVRLPRLIGDQRTLRQITLNLISNAIKATPPGGTITVGTAYELDGRIRLEIADTGEGLSQADVLRILGAGDSGEPAREPGKPTRGRAGLGLPIVRELAEVNGGDLAVDSKPGRGSRFSVLFARDRVAAERTQS